MEKKVKILGIAGSLRQYSYNKGLLLAAVDSAPAHCQLDIFDLVSIPLYNQDEDSHFPKVVVEFKTKIRAADAILFATPEYNYSISGVLKNAIDWASRPYGDNAWNGKPVAIMGATVGAQGTSRAQYHLRQILVTLNMYALNRPELMVSSAQDKFDDKGILKDAKTKQRVGELLQALIAAIK
jgi:chromate reductase